jgi:hypothetical protein
MANYESSPLRYLNYKVYDRNLINTFYQHGVQAYCDTCQQVLRQLIKELPDEMLQENISQQGAFCDVSRDDLVVCR